VIRPGVAVPESAIAVAAGKTLTVMVLVDPTKFTSPEYTASTELLPTGSADVLHEATPSVSVAVHNNVDPKENVTNPVEPVGKLETVRATTFPEDPVIADGFCEILKWVIPQVIV